MLSGWQPGKQNVIASQRQSWYACAYSDHILHQVLTSFEDHLHSIFNCHKMPRLWIFKLTLRLLRLLNPHKVAASVYAVVINEQLLGRSLYAGEERLNQFE